MVTTHVHVLTAIGSGDVGKDIEWGGDDNRNGIQRDPVGLVIN